jgi:hypothetical protein
MFGYNEMEVAHRRTSEMMVGASPSDRFLAMSGITK